MSDFNYQQWRTASAVTPAMLDSCLDRIRELEGQRDAYADRAAAVYSERKLRIEAEATIEAKERIIATLVSERRANRKLLEQAEADYRTRGKEIDKLRAALAERDRMLRLAVELLAGMVSDHGPRDVTEDEVLADLKARAEESHEGIDEDAPICPECRVSDVMGTGTKHLRSCSRADEAKP